MSRLLNGVWIVLTKKPSLVAFATPAQDGHTYERVAIERWFEKKGDVISPKTGLRLTSKDVVPNHSLRNLIQDYKASQASSQSCRR